METPAATAAKAPTLVGALLRAATDQSEDLKIVEDMKVQGKEKPLTYAHFREFLTGQQMVVVCALMRKGR